ncbi:pilus motility taxis protein HmpF [Chroococcidiopsis sp.]|uniref:pilus motility taxis protein HmpF n=1 Tax=Chroococcidiopsis sp. TaxID=3088168 RepID=UPI003F3E2D21
MLYLAEVQKQKAFMGLKTEIKLLAFQRADQSWSSVQGEEVVAAEEANNLNAGALILADLNANRQVQRIQEAGRPLVSILSGFSRQIEKAKLQEEEIEQWKESLTFQRDEMSRRHEEMEIRLEELEHIEEEYRRLQSSQSAGLDETTVSQVEELLERLSQGLPPTTAVRQELTLVLELVETQQATLIPHWQKLEQQKQGIDQQQLEVDSQTQRLQQGQQQWWETQKSLEQRKVKLQAQAMVLQAKQEYAQTLNAHQRHQEDLHQQLNRLIQPVDDFLFSQQVDSAALEQMPLDQLQQVLQDLRRDWENACRFVHEQEEELRANQQAIDEIKGRLSRAASDGERANIEAELKDEQDSYEFLLQTLMGQRQNLQDRKETLRQHQTVLWRRQGIPVGNREEDYKLDLDPLLSQIQSQKQQQSLILQQLEKEIEQMRSGFDLEQGMLDQQVQEQERQWQQLQTWQQELLSLRSLAADCSGRINLCEEILRPVQDSLDGLRQKLQGVAGILSVEASEPPQAAIAQIRAKITRNS